MSPKGESVCLQEKRSNPVPPTACATIAMGSEGNGEGNQIQNSRKKFYNSTKRHVNDIITYGIILRKR